MNHFCNYDTMEEAQQRAELMNDLADKHNAAESAKAPAIPRDAGFMNLGLYRYSAGPAFKTTTMSDEDASRMGGLYRSLA